MVWKSRRPSTDGDNTTFPVLPRRHARHLRKYLLLALLATLFSLGLVPYAFDSSWGLLQPPTVPTYAAWHEAERAMPQNDVSLPAPQGRDGKYLRFGTYVATSGWGNVLQELVFHTQLAFESQRTFVFYNYTYDRDMTKDYARFGVSETNFRPARVPLTAFLNGPIAGGRFPPPFEIHPPAVHPDFFETVCSNPKRIGVGEIKTKLGLSSGSSARELLDTFAGYLASLPDQCVELFEGSGENRGQVFEWWLFGNPDGMLSVWPSIITSPILTGWRFSPLVESLARDNAALIHPSLGVHAPYDTPLTGLLALHLRRGDFENHCEHLANWESKPSALHGLPGFPDRREPPPMEAWGVASAEGYAYMNEHCYPHIEQIVLTVQRIREYAKLKGKTLDRVYVLSNGDKAWLQEMKSALVATGGWKSISTSRDMVLSSEGKYVAQTVDMMIAARAELFIGNAWSTLTSGINLIRLAKGLEYDSMRFL